METKSIAIAKLVPNEGQVAGLPRNPRQWKKTEFDNLKKSIRECPELLDARGCLVYPIAGGQFVVIGGNMRLAACNALKMSEVPCIVLPSDLSADKLKEIAIKDNGAFGEWDMDALANEWDELPLGEWGVAAVAWPQEGEGDETTERQATEDKEQYPAICDFAMLLALSPAQLEAVEYYYHNEADSVEKRAIETLGLQGR